VVAWVPFNESWGVPDLPTMPEQRHCVQSLYHLTRTLDTTRPVIGNDGWESVATDILAIHDYDHRPDRIARRYHSEEELPRILERERPGGRRLVVEGHAAHANVPVMLTEFGGIAWHPDPSRTWGYSRCETREQLRDRYCALLDVVNRVALFAGYCYTQFTDTYQEANGLLTMDRVPKLPLDVIRDATIGEDAGIPGAVPGVPLEGPPGGLHAVSIAMAASDATFGPGPLGSTPAMGVPAVSFAATAGPQIGGAHVPGNGADGPTLAVSPETSARVSGAPPNAGGPRRGSDGGDPPQD
jgi:hypothetical protein